MTTTGRCILYIMITIYIGIFCLVNARDTLEHDSHLPGQSSWPIIKRISSLLHKLEVSEQLRTCHLSTETDVTSNVHIKSTNFEGFPSRMQITEDLLMDYSTKRRDVKDTFHDFIRDINYFVSYRKNTSDQHDINTEQGKLLDILTSVKQLGRELSGEVMEPDSAEDAKLISNKDDIVHPLSETSPLLGMREIGELVILTRTEATPSSGVDTSENVDLKDGETKSGVKSEQTWKKVNDTEQRKNIFQESKHGDKKFSVSGNKDKISHMLKCFTKYCKTLTTSDDSVRIRRNTKNEILDKNKPELGPNKENHIVVEVEQSNRARIFHSAAERTKDGEVEENENPSDIRSSSKEDQTSKLTGVIHNSNDISAPNIDSTEWDNHKENASVVNNLEASSENLDAIFQYETSSYGPDANISSNNLSVNYNSIPLVKINSEHNFSPPSSSVVTATDIVNTSSDTKVDNIKASIVSIKYNRHRNTNHSLTTPFEYLNWSRKYETITASGAIGVNTSTPSSIQTSGFYLSIKPESTFDFASTDVESAALQPRSDSNISSSVTFNSDASSRNIPQTDSGVTEIFREFLQDSKRQHSDTLTSEVGRDNNATDVFKYYPRQIRPALEVHKLEYSSFPDWEVSKRTWKYAWEIHVYILGCLFGLVLLYNMLSVVSLWRNQRLLPIEYFLSIHTLIASLCFTRSVYLLYDGYNSKGTYHVSLNHFLYSVPFPSLTSAFSLLLYWLLDASDMTLVPSSLQKMQVLIPFIVTHYLISMTTDILAVSSAGMQVMQFVCQVFFISWGGFLFFGYAYIFRKLHSQAVKRQNQTKHCSSSTLWPPSAEVKYQPTLTTALKVTFLTAICGLAVVGLEMYALVYTICTRERPRPWPWWLYHTVLRLLELCMCLTLSYTVSLPFRYSLSGGKYLSSVLCAPFSEILRCNHATNRSVRIAECSHFNQRFSLNSVHSDIPRSLSENNAGNQMNMDVLPMVDVQPTSSSVSDSLIIIDDVYVRFQTEHDINRIVDSFNDHSQGRQSIQDITPPTLRDDRFSSAYFNHCPDTSTYIDIDETNHVDNFVDDKTNQTDQTGSDRITHVDQSGKFSKANSGLFRVPSSVSILESMEMELIKAFECFKVDANVMTEQNS